MFSIFIHSQWSLLKLLLNAPLRPPKLYNSCVKIGDSDSADTLTQPLNRIHFIRNVKLQAWQKKKMTEMT